MLIEIINEISWDELGRLILYVVLTGIAFLKFWQSRSWYERALYVLALILSSCFSIGRTNSLLYPTIAIREEFSVGANNVCFKSGEHENIFFRTKYRISKPLALTAKLSYVVIGPPHYQVIEEDHRTILINSMFGGNKDSNYAMAQNGLIFDYETKLFLFSAERQNELNEIKKGAVPLSALTALLR